MALFVWDPLLRVTAKIRQVTSGAKPLPAPTRFMTAAEWVESVRSNPSAEFSKSSREIVYAAETMVRKLPGTIDEKVHWRFVRDLRPQPIPEAFLVSIPNGRVWGQGYVITPNNVFLEDISRISNNLEHVKDGNAHPVMREKELVPPLSINGRVAVLAAFGGRGFYHWMYDVLPRLEILRAAGFTPNSIDKFYINECVAPFQFASLEALGIQRNQVIQSHWTPHVQASELLAPSHVGELTYMPRWSCRFLKHSLRTKQNPINIADYPSRFYLTRRKTTHRAVTNEDQVVDFLQKQGFGIIAAEDFSVLEQAALFSSARMIVSLHGAGLSNLAFCEPGTKIIEIFHPKSVHPLYWTLSHQADLDYFYLLGVGDISPEGVDEFLSQKDITIDLGALKKIIAMASS